MSNEKKKVEKPKERRKKAILAKRRDNYKPDYLKPKIDKKNESR